jgi:hypothetical protein
MIRKAKSEKRRPDKSQPPDDGWIFFKRIVICIVGLFFIAAPLRTFARDREWSNGMAIVMVIGIAFFALGIFGNRNLIGKADFNP